MQDSAPFRVRASRDHNVEEVYERCLRKMISKRGFQVLP